MAVVGEHRASPALSLDAAAVTANAVDVGFLCDGAAVVGGSSLYSRYSAYQCQHVNAETELYRSAMLHFVISLFKLTCRYIYLAVMAEGSDGIQTRAVAMCPC
jgi:hypothetical protein